MLSCRKEYLMEKNPDYQLSKTVEDGIVEIVFTGEVAASTVETLVNEVLAIRKANNAKALLVDCRKLKGRFGVSEAYYRVRSYPLDVPGRHTAVVDIEENAVFQSFYEAKACDAGLSLKWFTDIDAARAWLKYKLIEGSIQAMVTGRVKETNDLSIKKIAR
jgi:hypothetical protein